MVIGKEYVTDLKKDSERKFKKDSEKDSVRNPLKDLEKEIEKIEKLKQIEKIDLQMSKKYISKVDQRNLKTTGCKNEELYLADIVKRIDLYIVGKENKNSDSERKFKKDKERDPERNPLKELEREREIEKIESLLERVVGRDSERILHKDSEGVSQKDSERVLQKEIEKIDLQMSEKTSKVDQRNLKATGYRNVELYLTDIVKRIDLYIVEK